MKKLNILIVDDNPTDIFLLEEALSGVEFVDKLYIEKNGNKALSFLLNILGNPENRLPDLIILDINMPVMDGHELLGILKSTEELKHIPVIIMTTSKDEKDVLKAYKGHTNSYIVKPDDFAEMNIIATKIKEYWSDITKLPNNY